MGQTIRVSLPGYNALTDTNLDHYSLYSDVDNVLIKRFSTGAQTVNAGQTPSFAHNLGYIPFYVLYADEFANGTWTIVNNQYNAFSLPDMQSGIDTNNLHFLNNNGNNVPIAYDIFYDNMNSLTAPSITESNEAIKVTRPGFDAKTDKNPNHYIMHSDLNNFKILKQGNTTINLTGSGTYSFAHGANVQAPFKFFVFAKFPDGRTVFVGNANTPQGTGGSVLGYINATMDATNIYIKQINGSSATIRVAYIIYGTGKSGTISPSQNKVIAVAKKGINAFSETNPDNFNFHSDFPTLKYYISGSTSNGATTSTTWTIPHNLGYAPFFITFVNDLAGVIPNAFCVTPYYWGKSSLSTPNADILAYASVDATNLYLKAEFQRNATGAYTFTFYYKIFKNNLGL